MDQRKQPMACQSMMHSWLVQLFKMTYSPTSIDFASTRQLSRESSKKCIVKLGLRQEDRDFHRLLWRDTASSPIKHLRMTRVIYGVSCTSHVATRSLTEVANRSKKSHIADLIKLSFYVDDFLGGANSLEEAIQLVIGLRQELLEYGSPLRKWSSNDKNLIKSISSEFEERRIFCSFSQRTTRSKLSEFRGSLTKIYSYSNAQWIQSKSSRSEFFCRKPPSSLIPSDGLHPSSFNLIY